MHVPDDRLLFAVLADLYFENTGEERLALGGVQQLALRQRQGAE